MNSRHARPAQEDEHDCHLRCDFLGLAEPTSSTPEFLLSDSM